MAANPSDLARARQAGESPSEVRAAREPRTGAGPRATHRRLDGRRQQFEARKVRRLIRHVDPWSVLKASLLFFVSVWLTFMVAAVIVWTVARSSGTIGKLETFAESNLQQPGFKFDGEFLFRQVGLIGLILTFACTAAATVASVIFNLISDVIGGVWITVIEEETTRPVGSPDPEALR